MKFDTRELLDILHYFGLTFQKVTKWYDTSHGAEDERFHYILDDRYVLKICSVCAMWGSRLQEISRLLDRYRAIGVYCPALLPTETGALSCNWQKEGRDYTCFVEEFAKYPLCDAENMDRREIVEHLGILATRYSNTDLSDTHCMWSIIDLAPLDTNVDEKQENANRLVNALHEHGYSQLGRQVEQLNERLRDSIMTVFAELPRCVFQGDLNTSNLLHDQNHFVGLIDFNCSGTDVNINVFLNETNWFPWEEEFARLSVSEILEKMDREQEELLSVIFQHYTMNEAERYAFPYYKGIVDLFQYPDVCLMVKWLGEESHRDKCVQLIEALVQKILHQTEENLIAL